MSTAPDLSKALVETLAPLADALLPLLLTALTWAAYQAAAWIRAKVGHELAQRALLGLTTGAETVVAELAQTTVGALKAAAADGKLTDAEIEDIRRAALGKLKSYLGPKGLALIADMLGTKDAKTVDRFLLATIEAEVDLRKSSPEG